jgi:hypothetical protein
LNSALRWGEALPEPTLKKLVASGMTATVFLLVLGLVLRPSMSARMPFEDE